MTLVLRKLLASSSLSIARALNSMSQRWKKTSSRSTKSQMNGRKRPHPNPSRKWIARPFNRRSRISKASANWPSRLLTMRGDRPSSAPCEQPSGRQQSSGRLRRPSSSPSLDEPRSIYFESSLTVRGKPTSCSSMVPTMTRSRSSSIKTGSSATKG